MTYRSLQITVALLVLINAILFAPVYVPVLAAATAGLSLGMLLLNTILVAGCFGIAVVILFTAVEILNSLLEL